MGVKEGGEEDAFFKIPDGFFLKTTPKAVGVKEGGEKTTEPTKALKEKGDGEGKEEGQGNLFEIPLDFLKELEKFEKESKDKDSSI